ncbi:MAG: alpha-amylase family glycosyl hydrolase [Kofleriaceae bacterium]
MRCSFDLLLALLAAAAACKPVELAPAMVDAGADIATPTAAAAAGWRSQVLYLVIPDRFRDGDASNDSATHCFDRNNPQHFHGGDFEGLRQNLGYVRDLGATAIWITPPNLQAGPPGNACGYHGYWIDYSDPPDDALQPELGSADDLAHLTSDMHASNMRFVLDMVVNHAGDTARLPRQHDDWFHDPATCGQLGPAEIYCPVDNHPDFKQERADVAAYLSSLEARAVTRYGVDGIRMDTAKHVPASYFRTSFFPAVRGARSDLFAVAEIFEEGSTSTFVPYLDAGFDSAFHYPLYAAITNAIGKSGTVDQVAGAIADGIARVGADRALDLVLFIDNHDVPRFANQPGFGVAEDEIRRRLLLALDLMFTLPGIPQLYYGDELGMYGGADPDNRRDLPAWATDPAGRAQPHPGSAVAGSALVYARVQKLSGLRRNVSAFADGEYHELWRQNGAANPNVYAFSRGTGSDIRIVVVSNGAAHSGMMHIPVHGIADGTTLVDDLGDGAPGQVVITGGKLVADFPAHSAAIYRIAP